MTVTAPDQTVWWDPAAVTAAALDQLRLGGSDVDSARVAALVPAAGQAINNHLDRDPTDPIVAPAPGPLVDAIAQVTVELYRRKDAPPSSVDGLVMTSWNPASVDPLAGVRTLIRPYRRRWGIG